MSTATAILAAMDTYDTFRWASELFEQRDYYRAADVLQHLLEQHDGADTLEVRELLARSLYHSAQVGRAAEAAEEIVRRDPSNAYAALLLSRSLERASRTEEAASARRLAAALGAPGMGAPGLATTGTAA